MDINPPRILWSAKLGMGMVLHKHKLLDPSNGLEIMRSKNFNFNMKILSL